MGDEEGLVGFRFFPTEEELLTYYLPRKLNGPTSLIDRVIPLLHIYDYNPWELPQLAGELCRGDREQWFFFTAMQEREARGGRPNRLTEMGYWKSTGSPCDIFTSQNLRIGRKKTMVFYVGRAPHGSKTMWKMNEYKVYDHSTNPQLKEELSLCRIYTKSNFRRGFDGRPSTMLYLPPITDEAVITNDHNQHNSAVENGLVSDMETEFETSDDSETRMLLDWLFDI